jgi:hypothetical protein
MITNFSENRVGQGLKKYFEGEIKRIRGVMRRVGEGFINDGRLSGNYKDRTGNLRSSIGYAIGLSGETPHINKTGRKVLKGFKGGIQGKDFGSQLIKAESENSLVMVGFAGMEYAKSVEARGYDVITGATKRAKRKLKFVIKKG